MEADARIKGYLQEFSVLPLPSGSSIPDEALIESIKTLKRSLAKDPVNLPSCTALTA